MGSYSPYTKSPSGVAIRLRDGQVFAGSYVERCAYNPSVPPLPAALIQAIAAGSTKFRPAAPYEAVAEVVLAERRDARIKQVSALRAHIGEVPFRVIDLRSNS